ncbi:MAG: ABC transporter ATP-binding protein [Anaerolineae bacterium]|nr:ABC transporter ATP-binding protein [Anaerolineae bacterium]
MRSTQPCADAAVVWLGARMVLTNELSIGDLLVFLAYLKSTLKPIQDFAKYTGRLAKAAAAGERVIDLLNQEPDVRNLPDARPAPAFRGQVRFEDVSFGYDADQPVLKNISFTVQFGQRVAIVGQSGNGKTTLTNLLMRLYDPTAGRVLIDGRDVREYTLESLRAQISVVMQDTILFAASVRENIALGIPQHHAVRCGARGAAGQRPRVHHADAAGLRHADWRARPHALERATPAPLHRPRPAAQSQAADYGRLHQRG